MHHSRLCAVLIDCKTADVDEAAHFWAAALGRPVDPDHPMSRKLSEIWHQPIVVEAKPGASGNLAWEQVSRANPDGYTWTFLGPATMANPRMYANFPGARGVSFRLALPSGRHRPSLFTRAFRSIRSQSS